MKTGLGLVIDKVGGVSVLHNNTGIILDLVNVDLLFTIKIASKLGKDLHNPTDQTFTIFINLEEVKVPDYGVTVLNRVR